MTQKTVTACFLVSTLLLGQIGVLHAGSAGCPSNGLLTAVQGVNKTLTSPNYPSNYGNNRNCGWNITAGQGQIIHLYFVDFAVEEYRRCSYDRLVLYDGDRPRKKDRLAVLCGSDCESMYSSTGRYMYIQFISDTSEEERGFDLRYKAVRSSTTSTPSNTLTTVRSSMRRTTITNPTPTTTRPDSTGCPRLGLLTARQDINVTLTSPNYPHEYDDNQNCAWKLTAGPWQTIRLYVVDLELEGSRYCYDKLILYDADHPWIKRRIVTLCGTTYQPVYSSTGRYMYVQFITDGAINRRGFQLLYTAFGSSTISTPTTLTSTTTSPGNITACPSYRILNASEGINKTLTSPNYPSPYDRYQQCTWILRADVGKTVRVYVEDLTLQYNYFCSHDRLILYNGEWVYSFLAKLCGRSNEPEEISSSGQYMRVKFYADGDYTRGRGFKLLYTAVMPPTTTTLSTTLPMPSFNTSYPPSSCGDTRSASPLIAFVGTNSTLKSPNYPFNYDANQDCGWKITADRGWDGYIVHIYIMELDMEKEPSCAYDSLAIYDSDSSTNGTPLVKLCGQRSGLSYYSTGRHMYLHFHTDSTTSSRGFKLLYEAVKPPFGVPHSGSTYKWIYLTAVRYETRLLRSDDYPLGYGSNEKRYYAITCGPAYVVHLQVLDMDLQGSSYCGDNTVVVLDSDRHTELARMCNYQYKRVNLYSKIGRTLYVRFTTGQKKYGKGFSLSYRAVSASQARYSYTTHWPTPVTPSTDNIEDRANYALIIAGVVGGFLVLGVFICVVCHVRKKGKVPRPSVGRLSTVAFRSRPNSTSVMTSSNNSGVYMVPASSQMPAPVHGFTNMAYSDGPPAYCSLQFIPAVVGSLPDPNQSAVAPPPYTEALRYMHPPGTKEGATGGVAAQPSSEPSAPLNDDVASDPAPIAASSQPEESAQLDPASGAASSSI